MLYVVSAGHRAVFLVFITFEMHDADGRASTCGV